MGCVMSACTKERKIEKAIYYWKTTFNPTKNEIEQLEKFEIRKLYLRFFDVKYEKNSVVPVAKLQVETSIPDSTEVVPVVYITNESLQRTAANATDTLANNIYQLISAIANKNHIRFNEIQVDCDWTDGTRKKYFSLLSNLKTISRKELSCTIRLHQLKYKEKTGVPPVDKGMLMFYNMGNLKKPETINSIYDKKTASGYLDRGMKYPLPLDLALACFKWEVLIRQGRVIALLNTPISDTLYSQNTRSVASNVWQVKNGFLHQGTWFQKGDIIREEESGYREMKEATTLLSGYWRNDNFTCTFYHWHNFFFNEINSEKTAAILDPLR
jgi:hypothetical protein